MDNFNLKERLHTLAALQIVDYVTWNYKKNSTDVIDAIKPKNAMKNDIVIYQPLDVLSGPFFDNPSEIAASIYGAKHKIKDEIISGPPSIFPERDMQSVTIAQSMLYCKIRYSSIVQ